MECGGKISTFLENLELSLRFLIWVVSFVRLRFWLVNEYDEARSRKEAFLQALQQELHEWEGIGRSYEVASS